MRTEHGALLAVTIVAGCATVTPPEVAAGWPPSDASRPLDHARCVWLALHSAPTAAAWKAKLLSAQAALRQAGTLPNPTLEASWEDFGWFASLPGAAVQQTFSLAVQLDRLLSTGEREAAARFDLDAQIQSLRVEQRRLAVEVCRSYDALVAARQQADLRKSLADVAEQESAAAARLAEAGEIAPFEAERQRAEAMQARAEAARAAADASSKATAFTFALGFGQPVELQLADDLDPTAGSAIELADALAFAAAHRPELAAAGARYEAALARARLDASRLRFLPAVAPGVRFVSGQVRGVGAITAELPIFDTGAAAIASSRADLLAAAADVQSRAQDVAAQVTQAVVDLHAAVDYLQQHARALAATREKLAADARRLFEAGEIPLTEMLQARRDAVSARVALVDAELDAAQASWPLTVDSLLSR